MTASTEKGAAVRRRRDHPVVDVDEFSRMRINGRGDNRQLFTRNARRELEGDRP